MIAEFQLLFILYLWQMLHKLFSSRNNSRKNSFRRKLFQTWIFLKKMTKNKRNDSFLLRPSFSITKKSVRMMCCFNCFSGKPLLMQSSNRALNQNKPIVVLYYPIFQNFSAQFFFFWSVFEKVRWQQYVTQIRRRHDPVGLTTQTNICNKKINPKNSSLSNIFLIYIGFQYIFFFGESWNLSVSFVRVGTESWGLPEISITAFKLFS